jgi:predicted nucleotide-binding protein (sugar kinase/HSP70/actin superfamily)
MTKGYAQAKVATKASLIGKTLYIPRMNKEGPAVLAAANRSIGVNAQLVPDADAHTIELARQYTIGEECYPEIVTLGGFLKVIEGRDFDPAKTAFLMATTDGPCRFGQYKHLLEKVLEEKGLKEVVVVAPTSANGYEGLGDQSDHLFRLAWWALVCADGLRKLLLQTRPYEKYPGDTDRVHAQSLEMLCSVIERPDLPMKDKFKTLVEVMGQIESKFSQIPANYTRDKLLIGVVGEIYCRLDDFANAELIRRVEKYGGEVWLASISEWVWYTNFLQKQDLKLRGERFSKSMLGTIVRDKIQLKDEHKLLAPLHQRFIGYEEPDSTQSMMKPAEPYLPYWGAIGEMVLNIGGAIYLYGKGADGIIDISPFSCMNGIVCEAIYPRVSKDYDDIPIRNFYFDGTESDYDRDVEIFLELAATYKRRKKVVKVYPPHFPS